MNRSVTVVQSLLLLHIVVPVDMLTLKCIFNSFFT